MMWYFIPKIGLIRLKLFSWGQLLIKNSVPTVESNNYFARSTMQEQSLDNDEIEPDNYQN